MNQLQHDVIQKIEVLFRQRLSLLKHYPVLTVSALQSLENDEIEEFSQKLDQRGELVVQIDSITNSIHSLIAQLDDVYGRVLQALCSMKQNSCPDWCITLMGDFKQMQKLLHNCVTLNARLDSHATAVDRETRQQLNFIHAQRKIHSSYATPIGNVRGMHINYRSK